METRVHRGRKGPMVAGVAVFLGGWCAGAAAIASPPDHVFSDGVEVYLLSAAEAAEAVVEDRPDPFFEKLTLLEIALRLGHELESTDLPRERARFKKFLRANVQEWTRAEKDALLSALKSAHAKCAAVVPSLIPRKWRFIKTSAKGAVAPHTRGSCIVLPAPRLARGLNDNLLIHETFHVYSRFNPRRRDQLYRTIGFRRLKAITLPQSLQARRVTNPDGVDIAYAITVKDADGRELEAIPVLYSKHETLQQDVKGFFGYLTFSLFEVRQQADSWVVVTDEEGLAKPLSPGQVQGFYEQIGRNTKYIIHPDEILADNVTLLVLSRSGDERRSASNPEILDKIERIIQAK